MNKPSTQQILTASKIGLARLRFIAVFLIAALVVGYWDNIKNHIDKWTRPVVAPDSLAAAAAGTGEYYCPMHPEVVRSEAGLCPKCGMPLVKRKRGEAVKLPADVLARVQLTPQRLALANVQTSAVEYHQLERQIRAVGVLEYDETRLARLSARVGGRADELFVQYSGQAVKRGEALYSLYSPEVYTALREYLLARKRVNELPKDAAEDVKSDASVVYNASLQKLVLWGITTEQLDRLDDEYDRTGKVATNLMVTSPIAGIVVRKDLNQGQYVQAGESPYTVADLSRLWLQVKLYEQDIALVHPGDAVDVRVEALSDQSFGGTVAFMAWQLDPSTRTLDARVVVENPQMQLRAGMFADAIIRVSFTAPTMESRASSRPSDQPAKTYMAGLHSYLQAQKLLSQDKTQGVAELLEKSAQQLAPLQRIAGDAYARFHQAVEKCKGQPVEGIRENFKEISAAMVEMGKTVGLPSDAPAIKVFRCPMKKAVWLQEGDDTLNPYYGNEMLTCGSAVESLPKGPSSLASPHSTGSVQAGVPGEGERGRTQGSAPTGVPGEGERGRTQGSAPTGRTLAIPRSAVINTGQRSIVYVESSPGVFDMHAVTLGPLAGEFYPVIDGLSENERVVTVGAFLLDAENRLNPTSGTAGPTR